jgi:ThiF family
MEMLDSLNRTAKLALDDGSASSIEDALLRFQTFDLQIIVGDDVHTNRALQAALVTILNAAPRTFMGRISVVGNIDTVLDVGWFNGRTIEEVASRYGVFTDSKAQECPTILVGNYKTDLSHCFALRLVCTETGFHLAPDDLTLSSAFAPVAAGVAAAGAALNELFQYHYFGRQWAGLRCIEFQLPLVPKVTEMPRSVWVIGLGHLGQAALWTLGLSLDPGTQLPTLKLQDDDRITASSLSTGLLSRMQDVQRLKVDAVADAMQLLGYECERVSSRVQLTSDLDDAAEVCLVAVDSYGFRRQLDKLRGPRVVEAGIGDGIEGFTKLQLHLLPGSRSAADIWSGSDPRATRRVSIEPPAYQQLLKQSADECGTTQLAGRSIATPFIGAFTGALMACLMGACWRQNPVEAWSIDVNFL